MNIYVSLCVAWTGGLAGYVLGLIRPLRRARNWAHWQLRRTVPGQLTQALILILLPEMTCRLLWHRLRHGEYPKPPARRPAPKLAPHWREKLPADAPVHLPEDR